VARSGNARTRDDRDYVAAAARRYGLTRRMKKLARLLFEGASTEEAARQNASQAGTR